MTSLLLFEFDSYRLEDDMICFFSLKKITDSDMAGLNDISHFLAHKCIFCKSLFN